MIRKLIGIALCLSLILCGCDYTTAGHDDIQTVQTPATTPKPTSTPISTPPPTPPPMPALFYNHEFVADCTPITHNGVIYVPVVKAVQSLYQNASIDQTDHRVLIQAEGLSVTINRWQIYVIANGRYLYNPTGVLFNDSIYYLPADLIATILSLKIQQDEIGNVFFTPDGIPLIPGDEFYDSDNLFWLSHIINAESGNQSLQGKIAVGNVVLNRVKHPTFPNSIYEVLFQNGQFYDSYSGAITKDPNYESIIAAKLCLEGAVILPNAYWFNGVGIPCWASANKTLVTVIGDHAFYG